MQKTLFETVYHEEFINVNVEKAELIEKLSQLQDIGRKEDTNGCELAFYINKRGKFIINNPQRGTTSSPGRNYVLEGRIVASKNDTSIVYIKYVYIRSWLLGIITLLITVVLPAVLIFGLTWKLVFLTPALIVPFLIDFSANSNKSLNKTVDFEIMKKEILFKLEAIEKWDK